jgi:hypothetical protein
MMMAWRAPRNAREANARQARHPGQPWLWREDWEQGFSQAARGGDARFVMTAMPGVLGGRLKGQVQASGLTPGAEAEFTLQCVSWRHAARNSRSSILWQDKYTASAQAPVDFEIPFDVQGTRGWERGMREEILWQLDARTMDGKFRASFVVPVFQTAGSDAGRTRERMEAEAGSRLAGFSPSASHIERVHAPEGTQYRLSPSPNQGIAAMMTFFGLATVGFAVLMLYLQGGTENSTAGPAGIVLISALGLAILLWAAWLWFGEVTVIASPHELRIHNSCLGMSRTLRLRADEIRGFEIRPGIQKGSEVWYEIVVRLAGERTATCPTGIDKSEAEWLVAEIRKELSANQLG